MEVELEYKTLELNQPNLNSFNIKETGYLSTERDDLELLINTINQLQTSEFPDLIAELVDYPQKTFNLLEPRVINGVSDSVTKNDLVEGISPYELGFLTTQFKLDQHFEIATSLLNLMEKSESLIEQKIAAITTLRLYVPVLRLIEDPHTIRILQDTAFRVLDPENYALALESWENEFGSRLNLIEEIELRNTLKSKFVSQIGIPDGAFDLHFRVKSLLSYYQKRVSDRSTNDAYAATLVVNDSILNSLPFNSRTGLFSNKKTSRATTSSKLFNGIVMPLSKLNSFTEIDDIYRNPRPYNPEYSVINTNIVIPNVGTFELRITTKRDYIRNTSDHPYYKHMTTQSKKIRVPEGLPLALGDYMQSMIRVRLGIDNELSYQFPNTKDQLLSLSSLIRSNSIVGLNTHKGRHLIFIEKTDDLWKDLENYVKSITHTHLQYVKGFQVQRVEFTYGNLERLTTYRIIREGDNIHVLKQSDEKWLDYTGKFSLRNFDNVVCLEEYRKEFIPIMSVGSILNDLHKYNMNGELGILEKISELRPNLTPSILLVKARDLENINMIKIKEDRKEALNSLKRSFYKIT